MPAKTRLPSARCGSYSSRSSIVASRVVEILVALEPLHRLLREVAVGHRVAEHGDALAGLSKERGDVTRRLALARAGADRADRDDGFGVASIVSCGEIRWYDAPAASAREPTCMTCSCVTSEYANTTESISCSRTSCSSADSGKIGMPSG